MKSPFSSPFFLHRNKSSSSPPSSATLTPTTSSGPTSSRSKQSHSPHRYIDNPSTTSFGTSSRLAPRRSGRSNMGQNNGKFEFEAPHSQYANPPQSAFSSPGPDPFHYSPPHTRPAPPPPVIAPEFYHAPHSAPVVPTTTTTMMSKPRGLIRTLSAKRRGESPPKPLFDDLPPIGSLKALKTLGQADVKLRMKDFEALVARAEAEAGLAQDDVVPPHSPTSKRLSIGRGLGLDEHTPSPVPLSATPAYLRPAPHRRSSTSSIHSSRASIKSARRAEREWRAKVAAISSGFSPYYHTSPKAPRSKGPVPPRRAPSSAAALSASQTSRSMSPHTEEEGTIIVTPPRNTSASFSTPLSNKSFETLGHYPNSSPADGPPSPSPAGEWDARSRKPSVPHSAISSVYEPHPRTSSLASSQLLAPSPLRVDTTNRSKQEIKVPTATSPSSCYSASEASPTTPHVQGRDLPPFESFQSSPRMVGSSALPQQCTIPVRRVDSEEGYQAGAAETNGEEGQGQVEVKAEREVSGVWETRDVSIPLPVSPPRDERKHRSLPSPPRMRSPTAAARPSLYIDASEISSLPPILPPLASLAPLSAPCTPVHATPRKPTKAQEPSTPYSPTTAYILSAESGSLDQMTWSTNYALFASSPQKQPSRTEGEELDPHTPVKAKHPFTIGAKPSPGRPSPNCTPELVEREPCFSTMESELTGTSIPSRDRFVSVPVAGPGPSQTVPRRASAQTDLFIPRQLPSTFAHNAHSLPSRSKPVLRPNVMADHHEHHPPSSAYSSASKLGAIEAHDVLARESGIKRRGKVDLTPGMEDGCRPPKSGLPMSDLAKWLAETAISSS